MAEHALPFDELNAMEAYINASLTAYRNGVITRKEAEDDIIDELLDLYLLAYEEGTDYANDDLDTEIPPDFDEMSAEIYRRIDGKNFVDRVREYVDDGTVADIMRVANTDTHRIMEAGGYNTAQRGGATYKIWRAVMDERTRDTHYYLDGTKVPLDSEFYTYNDNHTMFPGQFGVPEEDCNCRCWVSYSK